MLVAWKRDAYVFGPHCTGAIGRMASPLGARALLVANPSPWLFQVIDAVITSLEEADVNVVSSVPGSRPNSPLEDVFSIQDAIESRHPDVIAAIGGGSTIDAVKSAVVLAGLSPGVHDLEPFFGVGRVTSRLSGGRLTPVVALETAASSAAHLTKYSNITNLATGQKKLVIDDSIVPPAAVFDYATTISSPRDLTIDGALDGISHCLEVYYGAKADSIDTIEPAALAGIELCLSGLRPSLEDPSDLDAREALGLGTDLGGLCIMTGSTNGAHLTSFSLVDVTTHGRATAIMNPYYTVLFANAVERQLKSLAEIYRRAGILARDLAALRGRDLGLALACAMMKLPRELGVAVSLGELPAFSPAHIDRAVAAAKDPALSSKLQAMPIPMDASMVDDCMRPLLEAAASGDLAKVPTLAT